MNCGDRLTLALWEGDRHVAALRHALGEWDVLGQPDLRKVEAATHHCSG